MSEPQYKHDCGECVFLCNYGGSQTVYDVYVCPKSGTWGSVIFRFGNEGREYLSYSLPQVLSAFDGVVHL